MNTQRRWLICAALLAVALPALAQVVFPYFGPANGVLKGSASTGITTAAAASDITGLWTAPCDTTHFLRGDGSCQFVNLQTNTTSTLLATNGGTGATTLTAHGVLLGEGTSAVSAVAAMAADTLLQGQGASADPAAVSLVNCGDSTHALAYATSTHTFGCQAISAGSGTVTSITAGSGITLSTNPCTSTCTASVTTPFTKAVKPADTSRSNTTTQTDDPDLVFSSVPAGRYGIMCQVLWTAATTTPGIRADLNATGTTTVAEFDSENHDSNGNSNGIQVQPFGTVNAANIASANGLGSFLFHATLVTSTTGNVSIQWAQSTSNATATTVKQGSWCLLF